MKAEVLKEHSSKMFVCVWGGGGGGAIAKENTLSDGFGI